MSLSKAAENKFLHWEFPPKESNKCIGIICGAEIEASDSLKERIKSCETIIAVDGGLHHCDEMEITPQWIVGDFDSINPVLLAKYQLKGKSTKLQRAKDVTDLEVALEIAKTISLTSQVLIFGALGGRIDHTLVNIFLILRNPGQLFLESENQMLFAASKEIGQILLSGKQYHTLALFPLNGSAKNISIKSPNASIDIPLIDKSKLFVFPFKKDCQLNVEKGEVIVILDKRKIPTFESLPKEPIAINMSIEQPLINIFHHLIHQSCYFNEVQLGSEKEILINIKPSSGRLSFPCQIGQTISLIPLFGAATGIKTNGLKWELGEKVDKLDKNFIGISNVCINTEFSVQVEHGELLCVINDLIDLEMTK